MQTLKSIIVVILWTIGLGQQAARAAGDAAEYPVGLMLPVQEQPVDFNNLGSIAVAPDGGVWVANKRIQHFNADGGFIEQFEKAGGNNAPYSIAIAADNSIWIADAGNSRIQHLKNDGTFIARFGKYGSGAGEFYIPAGIAIAPDGSVWVVDTGNNRIQHFKSDGTFIAQFGKFGSGEGEVNLPFGITAAADGSVWVADTNNQRIQHFNSDGAFIAQFGKLGAGAGEFNFPLGISAATDDSVWVTDSNNHRIQHFKNDGAFIEEFGSSGTEAGMFSLLQGIAVAADNSIWVTDGNRIQHLKTDNSFEVFGNTAMHLNSPALAQDGSLWAFNSTNNHLHHYLPDGSLIAEFDTFSECIATNQPTLIAVAPDGSLWVIINNEFNAAISPQTGSIIPSARHGASCIHHFNPDGTLIQQFKSKVDELTLDTSNLGNLAGQRFNMAIASDNSVWLTDSLQGLILHFTANGERLAQFGNSGQDTIGQVFSPFGIALAADGSVWVTDTGNNRIQHFKSDGSFIAQFGNSGIAPGQFTKPTAITRAADGSLWIADGNAPYAYRIQHFNSDGGFIGQFGSLGPISGLAIAADGSLWVDDTANNRIYKFVPQTQVNTAAAYDDKFKLLYLHDVTAAGQHYQAILQQQGSRFYLASLLQASNNYTPAANYDPDTQWLTLPLARAFGQNYQAGFKQILDGYFQLQSATPQ